MLSDHQKLASNFISQADRLIQYLERDTPWEEIPGLGSQLHILQDLVNKLGYCVVPARFDQRGDPKSDAGRDTLLYLWYPRRLEERDNTAWDACTTLLTVYHDANGHFRRMPESPGLKNEYRSHLLECLRQWKTRVETDWLAHDDEAQAETPARAESPAAPAVNDNDKPPTDFDATHLASSDFTDVRWYGTNYTFDDGQQAKAIGCLWAEFEKGELGLSEKTIGEAIGSSSNNYRLAQTFRLNTKGTGRKRVKAKMHPAWGTMIQKAGIGVYRLVKPGIPR